MIPDDLFRSKLSPDPHTAKFYLGDIYYTSLRLLTAASPFVLIIAGALGFLGGTESLTDPATFQRLLHVLVIAIIVYSLFFLISGRGSTTYLYPEFATDDNGLWYRYLRRWRFLAWTDIEKVRPARSWMGQLGILIYSSQLPRVYGTYPRLYRAPKGRAIVVFYNFRKLAELQTVIEAHIVAKQTSRSTTS